MKTKQKPPYSKDRKLQLCFRCNRYCSRKLKFCPNPTCQALDAANWETAAKKD